MPRVKGASDDNASVATRLERVAELLAHQGANPFRVRAYRNAASRVRALDEPLRDVARRDGRDGLSALPGIGKSIASVIVEYLATGHLGLLERLEGQTAPEDLFTTLPGIGDKLASRLHDELGVDTLEELELAAHDGRVEKMPAFGPRRVEALRALLAARLSRSSRRRARRVGGSREPGSSPDGVPDAAPDVRSLLEVDREYRQKAASGRLKTIAPLRFNPSGEAWLPILHVSRGGFHFTALYSNTALAHRLGTSRDWVVIYYERDGHENQCTVVTERRGAMAGRRVVRGREAECRELQTARARRYGS